MKKIYSIIAAALFCATMNAQTLNEGFEGEDFPPAGWSVTNTSTVGWMSGVKGSACAKVAGTYGTESYLITPMLCFERPVARRGVIRQHRCCFV